MNWSELIIDFTVHIHNGEQLVEIDPKNIVREWNGREVKVILIGTHHWTGTIEAQTRSFIEQCIRTMGVGERAVLLAEGLAVGGENVGLHTLAPRGVRVIGSDCRDSAVHEINEDYLDAMNVIVKLITDANRESFEAIKDLDIVVAEDALVFSTSDDMEEFQEILRDWYDQDDALNLEAKRLMANVQNNYPEGGGWSDAEFAKSNEVLAGLIKKYHAEDKFIFAPWGIMHVKDSRLYEPLKDIKPLVLLPKEENELDYLIEFARFQCAIPCDERTVTLTWIIESEEEKGVQEMPYWFALMLSKSFGDLKIPPVE
jgi:hypothetical protein